MGVLTDYAQQAQPQLSPSDPMTGLNSLIGGLSGDIMQDYQKARSAGGLRAPQIQQASDELATSSMAGYDANAYDANAWAQAGIGAATPTLSALESLNRAIAGYSGVKLQQRADLGKRIQAEKQQKLEMLQHQQKLDDTTQKDSAEKLIQMWKDGLISKSRLAGALASRFFNTPQGVADRQLLEQGKPPIVIPNFKRGDMLQTLQAEIAKEVEQDKNYHFSSSEERDAKIAELTQLRLQQLDKVTNGAFSRDINANVNDQAPQVDDNGAPVAVQPPVFTAPPQAQVVPPVTTVSAPVGLDPENAEWLKTHSGRATQLPTMGAPGTTAEDKEFGYSLPPDGAIERVAGGRPRKGGPIPVPVAPSAEALAQVEQPQSQPPAPWGRYVLTPVAKPVVRAGQIFNKVEQQTEIKRGEEAEKNAEAQYSDISKQSEATAQWYDTLREMEGINSKDTGSFAKIKLGVGNLLESLGAPNSKAVESATGIATLNNLLMQGIQSRLSTQNGVQARDDAVREQQSFAQITDGPSRFKALIKQAQAKALRVVEKEQFYSAWKAQKGTYVGASTEWNNYIKDTPVFAMYGGKPVYYNQFIDGFLAKNKAKMTKDGLSEAQQVEEATTAWRAIAKGRK